DFRVRLRRETGATTRLKWRVNAHNDQRFLGISESGDDLWVRRQDGVLLRIDRSNGTTLNDYNFLWRAASFSLSGDRVYAFTADGLAYALQLKDSTRSK